MFRLTAEETLEMMIEILIIYLDELSDVENTPDKQFQYGEKLAYVECLEWIQEWRDAKYKGAHFNVEHRYPL